MIYMLLETIGSTFKRSDIGGWKMNLRDWVIIAMSFLSC